MKAVFITGTPASEKEGILDIMLPRYSKLLPKGEYIKIGRNTTIDSLSKKKGNVILVGDIVEKTPSGYRIVNEKLVKSLNPATTIVLHAETDNPEIEEWQSLIKLYSITNFSGYLKIIRVREGNIKNAIKELAYTLKTVL